MKKLIDNLKTICVFISIITLPFVYISFYNYTVANSENKTESSILVIAIIITHIITAKSIYDYHRNEIDKCNNAEGGKDRP
jgi:cytochrome bd-type quinol oxidase subunit 2